MDLGELLARTKVLGAALIVAFVAAVLLPATARAQAPEPAGAQDHERVAARGDCFDWQRAVAGVGTWWESRAQCPRSDDDTIHYAWESDPLHDTRICVQGKGVRWSYRKDRFIRRWFSLGCGTSGGGEVPWRGPNGADVLGYPKVRAQVQLGFLPGGYAWRA